MAVGLNGGEAGGVEGEAGEETQSGAKGIDGVGEGELGKQGLEEVVEREIEIEIEVAADGEFETVSFSVLAESAEAD